VKKQRLARANKQNGNKKIQPFRYTDDAQSLRKAVKRRKA
jgi:hypothetical protein